MIGVPTGDPKGTELTRQELLVLEFMKLAGAFKMTEADKAVADYPADQLESWLNIAMDAGTGQRTSAFLGILGEMMGPPLGDGTVSSISYKRQLVAEFLPLMNGVMEWRLPQEAKTITIEDMLRAQAEERLPRIGRP